MARRCSSCAGLPRATARSGHVETPVLTTGATPGEANDRLEAWSLFDVKAALDEAIAAAPKTW